MINFSKLVQAQFDIMCETGKLYRSSMSGQEVWDLYIGSFKPEHDPIFRDPNSSTHNCNLCKNFIRRYGNIVAIGENNSIMTMFDVEAGEEYASNAIALSAALKKATIGDVFFETFDELNSLPYESCSKQNTKFKLGIARNTKRYTKEEAEKFGFVKANETVSFDHLHLYVPKAFVDMSGKSEASVISNYRDAKNVFKRAMDEISYDTLNLVKDLIIQGSLLDGQTHLYKIEALLPLKKQYDELPASQRDNWCWVNSYNFQFAKFRNELIGTLCSDLSEGKEINESCKSWNYKVDPANYMKAKSPVTESMKKAAVKDFIALGYKESDLERRFATIEDIKASEILHSNVGDGKLKPISVFDNVTATSTRHKKSEFAGIEEVGIDKFLQEILPTCSSIEAFVSNNFSRNMVSLTTEKNKGSKHMFKWNNVYSWTFNGNLAGATQIKEAVKTAGGRVDGALRFSMIWNDTKMRDDSDLDAWCQQPDGKRIGYNTGYRKDSGGNFSSCGGQLDLDNTHPDGKIAIENIYFTDVNSLKNGVYKFWVNQFAARSSRGFKAEIEFDGEIYSYSYDKPVSGNVQVAEVTFKDGKFEIKHSLPATEGVGAAGELYGLETNKFHKVNLVCLSPNHWNDNNVGNKHYLFMLDGCKSPTSIRSFHIENLIPELAVHRKVFEVLGTTNMIAPTDKQLTGLGFNATVRDELIVRLQGSFKRVIKIKF